MSREEFVRMMVTDLQPAPEYFPHDAEINRMGAPALSELAPAMPLSPADVLRLSNQGHVVLDVRPAERFGEGHVPGALNIGLGGQFASWAGTLVPMNTPLIIVAETEANVDEALMRLARVGHESVKGFLKGGMQAWREAGLEFGSVRQISVDELRALLEENGDLQVIDVRRAAEYADGHVPRAASLPLAPRLAARAAQLNPKRPTAIICAGGYRSSAAASLLTGRGFNQLYNVSGGTSAWVKAGYAVE
jgi:rhodanese-related sulfurtransferase